MTTILVDASGLAYRYYYAGLKQDDQFKFRSDGLPVWAVRDFTKALFYLVTEGLRDSRQGARIRPSHLGIVYDARGRGWRHDLFPDYKANRPDKPDDLKAQLPLMRTAAEAFGLIPLELAGYEADDLIATYCRLANEAGEDVVVITGDKDLMQLVRPGVALYAPQLGKEGYQGYRPETWTDSDEGVIAKFGVLPHQVVDVQALQGDATDHVPGVPGCGEKTAAKWIAQYGDVEGVIENRDTLPIKFATWIGDNADTVRLSRQLVSLLDDVEVEVEFQDLELGEIEPERLMAFLDRMEFETLKRRAAARFFTEAA